MLKPKEKCPKCNELRYITRHHVKNSKGIKTGEIEKMCRNCHDEVEESYRLYGMIKHPKKLKKKDYDKTPIIPKSQESLIPFYALG